MALVRIIVKNVGRWYVGVFRVTGLAQKYIYVFGNIVFKIFIMHNYFCIKLGILLLG